jgi:inorganic pyrophosphatase
MASVIEIPQGSKSKSELDKSNGVLMLDRVLFRSIP